ncbi:PEP-CTERM sorting domain-containing protein [Haloferula sp. A504]|uniref:PEP-CTERM sorting domain-containing protein n=1 Tax=Haloferula sp. A504 TaxID=3373601 RepID=UPI0031CA906A|nr:PEP-CTERM sorting domain-containing protein [Verrucomicrobiaceae bacterium E54]
MNRLFVLAASFAFALPASAATGFFDGLYFVTSLNGGGNVYNQVVTGVTPGPGAQQGHNLTSDGFNPTLGSLGTTYSTSDVLTVKGFEYKTYENESSDVTHGNLFWAVYEQGGSPGAFAQFTDNSNSSSGNYTWTVLSGTTSMLDGLAPGDYTLELYTESYTNGVDTAGNIFGFSSNPTVNFTVVPEPSIALLGGLGLLGLLRRRR